MIAGLFHDGSGLGDQLHRYITVRTLAEKKGFDYGMIGRFKGDFFLNQPNIVIHTGGETKWWNEAVRKSDTGADVRSYDPEINFVEDNTIIDGSFEDSKYWGHNLTNINEWLKVEPLYVPNDICVVGFRGGEYAAIPELFLPREYFLEALGVLSDTTGLINVEVHTDDPQMASTVFPEWAVVDNHQISHSRHSSMGYNWRSARHAKYAIIPNSAFFILPRLLKHHEDPTAITIAPRFWAGRNVKEWRRPACWYEPFTYL